jgi:hypothetical protein
MKKPGRSLKIKEKSLWLGRALSCVVLESTRRTPPWASPIPRCSRPRSSSRAVATTRIGPVRSEAENFLTFLHVSGSERRPSSNFPMEFESAGGVLPSQPGLGARIVSLFAPTQPAILWVSQPVHFAPIRSAGSDRSGPRCTPTPTTTPRIAPSSGRAPATDPTHARSSIPR